MAKKGRKVIIRVAHPKMKKYLKDHPYMEPDGMQEDQAELEERCQKGIRRTPSEKQRLCSAKGIETASKPKKGV